MLHSLFSALVSQKQSKSFIFFMTLLCAFQIPMATRRRLRSHSWMQTSPVLYVKVHLRRDLYLVQFMASALNCWRSYLENTLDNLEVVRPYKRPDNLQQLTGWGLGADRAQMQTLMLEVTHSLLPHTFSTNKPEDLSTYRRYHNRWEAHSQILSTPQQP